MEAVREKRLGQDAVQASLRSGPAIYRTSRKGGIGLFRQGAESADYADIGASLTSVFYGHPGTSLPDVPAAAAAADVCRSCLGGATKTLPEGKSARLHPGR